MPVGLLLSCGCGLPLLPRHGQYIKRTERWEQLLWAEVRVSSLKLWEHAGKPLVKLREAERKGDWRLCLAWTVAYTQDLLFMVTRQGKSN